MDYKIFLKKYVNKFQDLYFIYQPSKGFIVWKFATGENVEILHIRTFYHKKGYAKELIKAMVKNLQNNPPYYSVFGFGLASRRNLKEIYKRLGFKITNNLPAPYKKGKSFIFYCSYNILKKIYL